MKRTKEYRERLFLNPYAYQPNHNQSKFTLKIVSVLSCVRPVAKKEKKNQANETSRNLLRAKLLGLGLKENVWMYIDENKRIMLWNYKENVS